MEPLWHQAFACLSSYTVVHLSNILWKFWALSKLQKTNDKKKIDYDVIIQQSCWWITTIYHIEL